MLIDGLQNKDCFVKVNASGMGLIPSNYSDHVPFIRCQGKYCHYCMGQILRSIMRQI